MISVSSTLYSASQWSSNLKDEGYIPNRFQDASRQQGSKSPGA
ncbi:Hypothetical protein PAU_03659 [Photorhabdus asymbiotica]|uniref:Uncharacterized protein n=1 Tax=Photorhabdus asymbiotica subsp. asymbiotica (strain ATCC 43949 / 3105-77) TaxID=553480 RepID=C7BL72_PHOAA|nr:Hypothetical protein PAU_03659 [Photorhabdus asymbiotica]